MTDALYNLNDQNTILSNPKHYDLFRAQSLHKCIVIHVQRYTEACLAEPPGTCKCSTKFNINVDEHLLSTQLNKPQVFSHTLACTNTTKHHQQHRHLHVGTGVSSHLPHFKTSEQQVKQCLHAKASVGLTV